MVNLEHKLTVDDLIVEYMMYKVKNGYEPSFLTSEFINFLSFFESKMQVEDSLHEGDKLFKRFFKRKAKSDWSENTPHMDMIYSENDQDYLIKANYRLSNFDKSVITTYFMDNGMGRYDNYKGKTFKIRSIIGEYLSTYPKRKIDENVEIDENDLAIGKDVAALLISDIWNSYINEKTENHEWPKQCDDIIEYLFEMDLAEIIGVESMKYSFIQLYSAISKRIAILYHQDRNLQISTNGSSYLARANYELLIQGHEKIMGIAYGEYKKALDIDLSTTTFTESHELDGFYGWDDDPDVKVNTSKVENDKAKKLVKSLDNNIKNS